MVQFLDFIKFQQLILVKAESSKLTDLLRSELDWILKIYNKKGKNLNGSIKQTMVEATRSHLVAAAIIMHQFNKKENCLFWVLNYKKVSSEDGSEMVD